MYSISSDLYLYSIQCVYSVNLYIQTMINICNKNDWQFPCHVNPVIKGHDYITSHDEQFLFNSRQPHFRKHCFVIFSFSYHLLHEVWETKGWLSNHVSSGYQLPKNIGIGFYCINLLMVDWFRFALIQSMGAFIIDDIASK